MTYPLRKDQLEIQYNKMTPLRSKIQLQGTMLHYVLRRIRKINPNSSQLIRNPILQLLIRRVLPQKLLLFRLNLMLLRFI
jgi:hypothetical protein